jgi:integrase
MNTLGRAAVSLSVGDVIAKYLDDKIGLNGQGKSQANSLQAPLKGLGGIFVADLSPEHVVFYRRKRTGLGIATGTVRRELGALRAALKWAERTRIIPVGSLPHFDLPPDGAARQGYLDRDQEALFWTAARDRALDKSLSDSVRRVGLFVCLALETAGRMSAVLGLTWDRVDFVRKMVDLRDPKMTVTKKRRVMLPMSEELCEVLEQVWAEAGQPLDGLVLGHDGSLRFAFTAFRAELGFDWLHIHDLRRTWATLRVMSGVPLGEVAAFMGDTVAVVERHYAMFSPDYLRRAAGAGRRAGP